MATTLEHEGETNTAMCTSTTVVFQARGKRNANDPKVIDPNPSDNLSFNPNDPNFDIEMHVGQIVEPYECDPTNDENFCWLGF